MTPDEHLKQIDERAEKATAFYWNGYCGFFRKTDDEALFFFESPLRHCGDTPTTDGINLGEFLENSRTDIPRLTAALREALAALEYCEQANTNGLHATNSVARTAREKINKILKGEE